MRAALRLLLILALLSLVVAAAVIVQDNRPVRVRAPPVAPARTPYAASIAGSGVIEAQSRNIAIGTPVSGVVTAIDVALGEQVKTGQPLFRIDDRDLQAQLVTAEAQVGSAAAALREPEHQLQLAERLLKRDPKALSPDQLSQRRDQQAVARAALDLAKARREQLRLEIVRHTVRAPVDGEILQLTMRLGEYVEASARTAPMLVLGDTTRLNVRVDIDQEDAWRYRPGAPAVGFIRGDPRKAIPLRFAYLEPLVVPKSALTGVSTERVDTRVLQVLYGFDPTGWPVHVGQQLDVYIQAPPVGTPR